MIQTEKITYYTLSEAWSGVNWADLRPKHRAYYRSCRPVIKIGPKGALGSHEIRPIHSAPSLGQSIPSQVKITLLCAGPSS